MSLDERLLIFKVVESLAVAMLVGTGVFYALSGVREYLYRWAIWFLAIYAGVSAYGQFRNFLDWLLQL